jgi:hypothetical protein
VWKVWSPQNVSSTFFTRSLCRRTRRSPLWKVKRNRVEVFRLGMVIPRRKAITIGAEWIHEHPLAHARPVQSPSSHGQPHSRSSSRSFFCSWFNSSSNWGPNYR